MYTEEIELKCNAAELHDALLLELPVGSNGNILVSNIDLPFYLKCKHVINECFSIQQKIHKFNNQ